MKLLIKIVVVLVLLVIIALLAGLYYIDHLAKIGIEQGATYALGVDTQLDSADVEILAGEFSMSGLNVANPPGFDTAHFLKLGDGGVAVSLGTLRNHTVELPQLTLAHLDMNLEKKQGQSNYNAILDNLKRLQSGQKPAEPSQGKRFMVREILIEDVNVHVDLLGFGGQLSKIDVPVKKVRLTEVGTGEGGGVKFSELVSLVIQAVFLAVVENGADLPAELIGELQNGLAALPSLDQLGIGVQAAVGDQLQELTGKLGDLGDIVGTDADLGGLEEQAGEMTRDVAGEVGDKVKELGKELPGLFGGEKDKDK